MAGSTCSSTATTVLMSPTPAVDSKPPPNFVLTSSRRKINLNIKSNVQFMVRVGLDGRSILIHTEKGDVSISTPRNMSPAPPPHKISLEIQTGEDLFNEGFIRWPNFGGSSTPASLKSSKTPSSALSASLRPPVLVPQCSINPTVIPQYSRPPVLFPQCPQSCDLPVPPPNPSLYCSPIPAPPVKPLFQNAAELIHLIQTCYKCDKNFSSRRKGVDHQRIQHNVQHCPVCFVTISRQEEVLKDHLKMYHVLEGGKTILSCPFCCAGHSFEGLYRHIGGSHLIPAEIAINSATYPAIPTPATSEVTRQMCTPPQNLTSRPNPVHRRPGPASKTGRISLPIRHFEDPDTTDRTKLWVITHAQNNPLSPQSSTNLGQETVSPTPGQPRSKIAKQIEQDLSGKIHAAIAQTSYSDAGVHYPSGRTSHPLEDEMSSSSPQDKPGHLKTSQVAKLTLMYQQMQCYPDANIISDTAAEFGVTFAVIAKCFTKMHMDQCQRIQQNKWKRKD